MEVGRKKMEKKALEGKRIVVVDDDPNFRSKYAALAKELGAEVVTAEGVREGIEVILANKPDAVVTDKDMPDGSGNDVADAVKNAYADVPVAGITGGNPNDFKNNVDVKLSKNINDQNYKKLVQILIESNNPAEDFDRATGNSLENKKLQNILYEVISPVDILVQGYIMMQQVMAGEQPVEGMVLGPYEQEIARTVLELEKTGMTPETLLDSYAQMKEIAIAMEAMPLNEVGKVVVEFVNNPDVKEFMQDMAEGNVDDMIAKKQYEAFHDAYFKMAEVVMK